MTSGLETRAAPFVHAPKGAARAPVLKTASGSTTAPATRAELGAARTFDGDPTMTDTAPALLPPLARDEPITRASFKEVFAETLAKLVVALPADAPGLSPGDLYVDSVGRLCVRTAGLGQVKGA